MNLHASAALQPLAPAQRLQVLDVVRGFALLGILLMNLEAFFGPLLLSGTGVNPALTGVDRWVDALIYIFVQGKFYTLFSLLFGMGFAVMSQRAQVAGRPFAGVYWRRALVLMGIGVVHALLIWSGDILFLYALMSMLLLAFRSFQGVWLVGLGVLAYLVGCGWVLMMGGLDWLMQLSPESAKTWNAVMDEQSKVVTELVAAQVQAYGQGTYVEATTQRLLDFGFNLANIFVFGPMVLGLFLLGKWFVESGAIVQPAQHPRLFAYLRWLALPVGLLLMLGSVALQPWSNPERMDITAATAFVLNSVASLLMSLGYLAWLLRALQAGGAAARGLVLLAPAGRMALTNYLMQSLLCTLIAYGYGLGWFGELARAWHVPFALGLFLLQVFLSHLWLNQFRFGPMEWMWRSLTYLKAQPMRVSAV